ncbi:MAG TPA: gamma-glutamyltransferase [Candidatus Binatia bacterium]|nr:gamma-glutamyltransferase [Candidatus Binatia bacterium]
MTKQFSTIAKNGMVASSQPLATLAGVEMLMNGGNAIDAAIATAAVLGVVEPSSIGIGSDAFCLFYSAKEKALKALDASGRSPYAVNLDFCRKNGFKEMPQRGIHSVTVPGAVHGWETLLHGYGRKKLGDVLHAAIRHAEEGFPVAELTAHSWQESTAGLRADEGGASNYLINGRAPKAGEIFKNPRMAGTLKLIADGGAEVFYRGEIADKLVRCSERLGGLFTKKDFADHQSDWVEPITVNYRGYDIYEMPPATQGFVALQMLKILEGFDLKKAGPQSGESLHLMIEAKKLAFADRDRDLADRDFMTTSINDLLHSARIETLFKRIQMGRASETIDAADSTPSVSPPQRGRIKEDARQGDTEYVAAADGEGNLVSFIQSNFMGFGSGVVEPETGIILQNRGHLFSLDEKHPNCIGPHKRCVHTLMPGMILRDGKPYAALGLKGGHVQPQVQVQMIANLIDFGMTPQEAISAPRFNHIEGLKVGLEPEFDQPIRDDLTRRGHQVVGGNRESFGGAHAILVDAESGAFIGGSDPRKGGCALGF